MLYSKRGPKFVTVTPTRAPSVTTNPKTTACGYHPADTPRNLHIWYRPAAPRNHNSTQTVCYETKLAKPDPPETKPPSSTTTLGW